MTAVDAPGGRSPWMSRIRRLALLDQDRQLLLSLDPEPRLRTAVQRAPANRKRYLRVGILAFVLGAVMAAGVGVTLAAQNGVSAVAVSLSVGTALQAGFFFWAQVRAKRAEHYPELLHKAALSYVTAVPSEVFSGPSAEDRLDLLREAADLLATDYEAAGLANEVSHLADMLDRHWATVSHEEIIRRPWGPEPR